MIDKVSMQEYLTKMQALVNDLKASSEPVKDSKINDYNANKLGPDFRWIMCSVRAHRGLKFDKFYHLLIREDLSLK